MARTRSIAVRQLAAWLRVDLGVEQLAEFALEPHQRPQVGVLVEVHQQIEVGGLVLGASG